MGRRRKVQQDELLELGDTATAETLPAPTSEPVTILVEKPAPRRWRVVKAQRVSLFGQMTTLPVGTIVSAASYGPDGLRRIHEQGVALEPV